MIGNVRLNIWSLLLLQIFGLGDLFQLYLGCVKAYSIWLQIFGLGDLFQLYLGCVKAYSFGWKKM